MSIKNNILVGKKGEDIATKYLEKKGYKIIERNWHYSKNAEIDIIAEYKKEIVFIEVKTRTNLNFGHPFESITKAKVQKIHKAIYAYIKSAKKESSSFRFDGIAIIGLDSPTIEHIQNLGQF